MNKNLLIGFGVIIAVAAIGFYFIKGTKLNYGPTYTAPSAGTQPAASAVPSGPVKEIKVSAKEFAYTPSTITVKKGENVKLTLINDGTTAHNLTIGDLTLATKTVGPGESDSITFTADTAGTFTFFCSVDSHESLGLKGTLIVK